MRVWPLLLLLAALPACRHTPDVEPAPSGTPTPSASPAPLKPGGAVASPHPKATEAGLQILRAGGSAADAAVATALVVGVVNPQSSGLGGGGFAVVSFGDELTSLDFRETAPSFFSPDTFAVEGRSSQRGAWAAGVPGEPAGLAELHRRWGRLPWGEVVEPARRIAEEGFVVLPTLAAALKRREEGVLADPGLRAAFAPQGRILQEGETCRRPALAETLEYLQLHGGEAFYRGPLAVSWAGFLEGLGAPWTPEELASYRVVERPVLQADYRGHRIAAMGPPSSGGIATIQVLQMLEQAGHSELPYGSAEWSKALAQALRHAFADRAAYGGDPDFNTIPLAELLEPALAARLWQGLPERGPVPLLRAGLAAERGQLKDLVPDDHGTTHLSVIDADGAAVALTTTINLTLGAVIADPRTGVVVNDEMDDFNTKPKTANAFGLVQGDNNRPGPGHRPTSSMSPTLVLDEQGRVLLAVGGAGGPLIITGTLETLLGVVDRGEDPQAAVARARLHHQWLPEVVLLDDAFPEPGREGLVEDGWTVQPFRWSARVQAVAYDPSGGTWAAGADPRGDGTGAVWAP